MRQDSHGRMTTQVRSRSPRNTGAAHSAAKQFMYSRQGCFNGLQSTERLLPACSAEFPSTRACQEFSKCFLRFLQGLSKFAKNL